MPNPDDGKDQQLPPSFKDHDPDPDGICFGEILHELLARLTTSKKKLFSSAPRILGAKRSICLLLIPRPSVPRQTLATTDVRWYHRNSDIFPIEPPRVGLQVVVGLTKPTSLPPPNIDSIIRFLFLSPAQNGQPIPRVCEWLARLRLLSFCSASRDSIAKAIFTASDRHARPRHSWKCPRGYAT